MTDHEEEFSIAQYIEQLYHEHAAKLGQVIIAWNSLQNEMGQLFASIITPQNYALGLAAWHAIQSDRAQRMMLEAAAKEHFDNQHRFWSDLRWALGQAHKLEDERNNVIHAPYTGVITDDDIRMVPDYYSGSKRAFSLKGKDLKIELKSLTKRADHLKIFFNHLASHQTAPDDTPTWPSRPRLPRPAQPNPRAEQNR